MDEDSTKTLPQPFHNSFWAGVKYEHLVAGVTGGVVSTLITHPFDLIKLRFAGELECDVEEEEEEEERDVVYCFNSLHSA